MMQELNYICCGDYYIPDIRLPEENRPIGRWGRMHRDYIKEHRPILFNGLCLNGNLWTYLANLNEQAQNRLEFIIEQKEQEELRQKIAILEEEIQNHEDQVENVDKFIQQAKKYLHLEKLTPTVLNDMVNAVYVHAPDKSSGHRVQDVEISYNYIGILPANLLYDIQKGKTA